MTHQSYLDPLAKTSVRNSPAPWKLPIFGFPPPRNFRCPPRGGGGGRDIFWNYTLKTTATTTTRTHTQKMQKQQS